MLLKARWAGEQSSASFFPRQKHHTRMIVVQPGIPQYFPRAQACILLAEDEALILEASKRILEKFGNTGWMRLLMDNPPWIPLRLHLKSMTLSITDMSMPKMNGRDLVKNILMLRPDIPVILCTGFHETFTPEAALERGNKAVCPEACDRPGTGRDGPGRTCP